MRILVTGGLGFIGSATVRELVGSQDHTICNVDKNSYASTLTSLEGASESEDYTLVELDLAEASLVDDLVSDFRPDVIVHLAAESHVDRSIDGPEAFVSSNIVGTFNLLEAARRLHSDGALRRFLHISTDEVFGSLGPSDPGFTETSRYQPRSPYSASKAAADHLVAAWGATYSLPVLMTNCSNNYGPYQFPEKLIPLMTIRASRGQSLPVYGEGSNVRDWLHVSDHVSALLTVLEQGRTSASYNIGGGAERTNLEIVRRICQLVDQYTGETGRQELIEFVKDRPGHDHRYAIDSTLIRDELGWTPSISFDVGLASTVKWYLDNEAWWNPLMERPMAGERLGTHGSVGESGSVQ